MSASDAETPRPEPRAPGGGREDRKRTARFAGLLGAGILLSRLLGLVRDGLVAYFLGTGLVSDAWLTAFRIPNVLRLALTEGAMSSAFVPVFNEYLERHSKEDQRRLLAASIGAVLLFLCLLTFIGWIGAPLITRLVAPGFASIPGKLELTAHLMRWTFLYVLLLGLAGLLMGALQSLGFFLSSALSPPIFNVGIILSFFLLCPMFGDEPAQWVNGLLLGALLAGALQLGVQIPPLVRRGMMPLPRLDLRHPGVRRMGRLIVPTLVGVGVTEMTVVVTTFLASLLPQGAMSVIEFSGRIVQVPYAIIGGALATALLPLLSRHAVRGHEEEFRRTLSSSLRVIVFLMVPLMALVVLESHAAVALLFERGEFDAAATARTAGALAAFAPLLLGASTVRVASSAFYSLQDTRTPVVAGAWGLLFNAVVGYLAMKSYGVAGLALSASLSTCLSGGVLLLLLVRRTGRPPLAGWGRLGGLLVVGGMALVLAVLGVQSLLPRLATGTELIDRAVAVLAPAAVGLTAYLAVATLLRSRELAFLVSTFLRRRG